MIGLGHSFTDRNAPVSSDPVGRKAPSDAGGRELPVLEVEHLGISFVKNGRSIEAVRDVSFTLSRGETLGIVGESGCGKSLTASAVMRLLPGNASVTGGRILLDGRNLFDLSEKEMESIRGNRISMIFQDPMTSLNPVYRIRDQLAEIILAHEKISKNEAWNRSVSMLRKVGIPDPEDRMMKYPHELSGGMRQRIMIAMALLSDPDVLIADEPTTALDVTIQAQILDLIGSLQKEFNTAVLLITHDMGVIAENADRVAVMYAGEVAETDVTEGIFRNPGHPYTQGLLGSIPVFCDDFGRLKTIKGTVPTLDKMPEGCRFCTRCPYALSGCQQNDPGLVQYGSKSVRCARYRELSANAG